jgi:hypothetical protein
MKPRVYGSNIQAYNSDYNFSQGSNSFKGGDSLKPIRLSIALVLIGILTLLISSLATNTVYAQRDIVVQRGETVTITVVLLQNGTYGNPVPEQMIEFFDQTHNLLLNTDTTDSDGLASIDWSIPLGYPLGPTLINATFRGNESLFLSPSTQWVVLHIVSSVQLVIDYNITPLAPGDQFSFTVLLLDDTSAPIGNASLIVLNGNTVLTTSSTNSSGLALFTLHCNNSWSVFGENTIRVVHQEDLINFYASAEESFTINIQQIITSINVNNSPDEIALGSVLEFEVSLSGSEGGISTEVGVFVDDALVDSITTDTLGSCSYNLIVDTRFLPGIHTFQLVYNGSERYAGSFTGFELRIISPVYLDIEIPTVPIIGNVLEFRIGLLDYFNRPFDETIIRLSDATNTLNNTSQVSYLPPSSSIFLSMLAPPGLHDLEIELVNPFITNNTYSLSLVVWSRPKITLEECNILHFASPNQKIAFSFEMTDWTGNCSNRSSQVLINGLYRFSAATNNDGIASFTLSAPSSEGMCNLSLVYTGNITLYELTEKYEYLFMVSYTIPIQAELIGYEVVPPLQEVRLNLRIRCLNGTLLSGIYIRFIWLTQMSDVRSQDGGFLTLHLAVPQESGNYSLYYEIDGGHGLYHSGSIEITILLQDILASQGVGIKGFIVSIIISFCAILPSIVKQRSLVK